MYELGDCQPALSVDVPYGSVEGCLLKRLAIRAYSIIHGRSPRTPAEFVRQKADAGGASLIRSGAGPRRGVHSPASVKMILANQKATANGHFTDGDTGLLSRLQ